MTKKLAVLMCLLLVLSAVAPASIAAPKKVNVNVVLNQPFTREIESQLKSFGKVGNRIDAINAFTMSIKAEDLPKLLALDFVEAANADAVRSVGPVSVQSAVTIANEGFSTWNLDAINVTDPAVKGRTVLQTGKGVYIAVLDTGLISYWRNFFPADQILTQYAKSFGGGGSANAAISEQPNKWEQDVNSHGTHVTSTILGYSLNGDPIYGVAPEAKVIPVKVLNQNGSGSSFVIAEAIVYVANLKEELQVPMVINMSLGGSVLDAVEKAAVDYAVEKGVILVAAAGNSGMGGMGYPAAYEPVISVAASGWTQEWLTGRYWWLGNVADPIDPMDFYIADFSSRDLFDDPDPLKDHDLDVAAPGSWIVGPYSVNQGSYGYYFLGGTSMACPHVAGAVALMLEKDASLTPSAAEDLLEMTAVPLGPGSRKIYGSNGVASEISWGLNATGHGLMDVTSLLQAVQ